MTNFFKKSSLVLALVAIFVVTFSFNACKRGGGASFGVGSPMGAVNNVPETAFGVGTLNIKNLIDKAGGMDALKNTDFYRDALKKVEQENPAFVKIMENPAEAGIDIARNVFLFMEPGGEKIDKMAGGLVFLLTDAAKFEAALKEAKAPASKKEGDINIITENNEYAVAWNSKMAYIGGGEGFNPARVKDIFNNKKSISSNAAFSSLLGENHDISFFINSTPLAELAMKEDKNMETQLNLVGLKKDDLMGNNITYYGDFKDGLAEGGLTYDLKKGIRNFVDPFFKDDVKTNFQAYMSKNELIGAMTFGLNTKGIVEFVKKRGYDAQANQGLAMMGLKLEDLAKGFTGDMAASFYGKEGAQTPDVLFVTTVGDQAVVDKIVGMAAMAGFKKEGNRYVMEKPDYEYPSQEELMKAWEKGGTTPEPKLKGSKKTYLAVKDGKFFFATSENLINTAEKGGFAAGEQLSADVYKKLANNIMGGYVNYASYMKIMNDMVSMYGGNVAEKMGTEQMSKLYENGFFSMDRKAMKFVANMKDKSKNSLKSTVEVMNETYKAQKKETETEVKDEVKKEKEM